MSGFSLKLTWRWFSLRLSPKVSLLGMPGGKPVPNKRSCISTYSRLLDEWQRVYWKRRGIGWVLARNCNLTRRSCVYQPFHDACSRYGALLTLRVDFHGLCKLFARDFPSPFSTVVVRVTRTLVSGTTYAMTRSIVRSGQWALLFFVLTDRSSVWTRGYLCCYRLKAMRSDEAVW